MRKIYGFDLTIPEFWYEVPLREFKQAKLASIAAEALPGMSMNSVAFENLLSQLQELSWTAPFQLNESSVVLAYIPPSESGDFRGVLSVRIRRKTSLRDHQQELEGWPNQMPEAKFLRNEPVKAHLPGFYVEGAWLLLSVPSEFEENAYDQEERMALGVFPGDCRDMIEAVCVAGYIGAFPDMRGQILAILATLNIKFNSR